MRALVVQGLAQDFSRVELADVPTPRPQRGEVRVKVEAAALNFPDLLMLKGEYQFKPPTPFVAGMEYAGVIDDVDEGVETRMLGLRVAGGAKTGAFAEFVIAKFENVQAIPDGFSFVQAAAYSAAYTTAHVALIDRGRLQPGETLLVHGASGGVGMAAIDVGLLCGARVIATTGVAEKASALKAFGAEAVIVLGEGGFREQVKALTQGRGADVIFDPVGGEVLEESMRCIAFDGRLLIVGFAGGTIAQIKTNIPLIKGFALIGVRAGEYGRQFPEKGRAIRETLWRWAAEGRTRPVVFAERPLAAWREAYALMRDRRLVGKVVLRP